MVLVAQLSGWTMKVCIAIRPIILRARSSSWVFVHRISQGRPCQVFCALKPGTVYLLWVPIISRVMPLTTPSNSIWVMNLRFCSIPQGCRCGMDVADRAVGVNVE